MWLEKWGLLAAIHHSLVTVVIVIKSNLMFLINHDTSHDHLFKCSGDYMLGSPT